MRDNELEVLHHLLQGIMDSTDMANLFCLVKKTALYRHQHQRLPYLMRAFQHLNQLYITRYQEIPVMPTTFQRIVTGTEVTSESEELVPIALQSWVNWETRGVELYTQMLIEYPNSYLYKKLLFSSRHCLKVAQQCQSKYVTAPIGNNLITNKKSVDIRQRMKEKLAALPD